MTIHRVTVCIFALVKRRIIRRVVKSKSISVTYLPHSWVLCACYMQHSAILEYAIDSLVKQGK